ncbi:MAG: phenylalanine--tRNA ligase subunit beta [Candidatus Dormibacteria bacterium]
MKISLDWLRQYGVLDAPLDTLVQGLIDTGTEVDGVERGPAGIVAARIVGLEPVPESTRGVLFADIDVGSERIRVLTGAANLDVGDLVPYAPPGTTLPGAAEPLGVRSMFGGRYSSPGMLCSAAELGVGEDAAGIHHLDHGVPGQPLHEVLALDTVLEVEVTTNRPDCLCHVGVAREMAAAVGETVREPDPTIPEGLLSAASLSRRAKVEVEDGDGCPRFAVRIIENIAVAPSPQWMQRRLRAVGLRPINNIVDVTNYVAREIGQPLHAFDLDRFVEAQAEGGRAARVVVRRGRGEAVVCLDGVERSVGPDDMAVCAAATVVSIAGVIGGAATAVDEATHNVLLEAASWDGPTVRATSKRLGVRTDASSLYEKGLSDTLPPIALDRAAALIAELGGGHVLKGSVDVRARPLPAIPAIEMSGAVISAQLGYPVDATEAATVLARLDFGVEQEGDELTVTVPHFRRDVAIVEDVVEEVGRSLGYERLPSTLPGRRTPVGEPAAPTDVEDRVKEVLVGAGYDEAITWSFVSRPLAGALQGIGGERRPIPLRNPLTEEWSVLRTSLLPGVVQAVAGNLRRGVGEVSLFELGRGFWEGERRGPVPGSTHDAADDRFTPLPAEPLLLGAAASAADADGSAARLRDLQALVVRLAADLGAGTVETEPARVPGLHRGRSGRLVCDGQDVGLIGELEAGTAARFGLRGRLAVAEIQLDSLIPPSETARRYLAPPRFPAVVQDLAVTVPEATRAGDALGALREAGGALVESAVLYDEYRSAGLGPGRKGWTFRIAYRAADRTLTSEEAQSVQEDIASALLRRCAAEVRRSPAG